MGKTNMFTKCIHLAKYVCGHILILYISQQYSEDKIVNTESLKCDRSLDHASNLQIVPVM